MTAQPTSSGAMTHPAGTSPSHARTIASVGQGGVAHDPVFVLVLMLGLGFLILHLSFAGSVTIKEGK